MITRSWTHQKNWHLRPIEQALYFNPGFSGELIYRCMHGYRGSHETSLPLPLAFLVLPLTIHTASRSALPGKSNTNLYSWASQHADIISLLPERVLSLRPVTQEALIFLGANGQISFKETGISVGPRPISVSRKPKYETEETRSIRRASALLGRWFSFVGSPAAILQLFGLKL